MTTTAIATTSAASATTTSSTIEWSQGDLVWFDTGAGHPLPGEIQEVHRAAQIIIVQALINGKVRLHSTTSTKWLLIAITQSLASAMLLL